MTEQEAIEVLKGKYRTVSMCIDIDACKENNQAVSKAVSALEKQIPKKPILKSGESVVHTSHSDGHGELKTQKWQDWVCPVCGWFVGQRYNAHRNGSIHHPHDQRKSDWCNECGQRIDWSEK